MVMIYSHYIKDIKHIGTGKEITIKVLDQIVQNINKYKQKNNNVLNKQNLNKNQ